MNSKVGPTQKTSEINALRSKIAALERRLTEKDKTIAGLEAEIRRHADDNVMSKLVSDITL